MNILFACDGTIASFLLLVKNGLNLIMIIVPIIAIIYISIAIAKMVRFPDQKNALASLKNKFMALAIVFFIPLFLNVLMIMLGENTSVSECWNNVGSVNYNPNYIETEKKDKHGFLIDPDSYEKGVPKQLTFDYDGNGTVKARFSEETLKIVEAHINDFNYYNFKSFMAAHGGAGNYIKSLGGVFTEYYGRNANVSSPYELQKVSEYVYGLMYIWGFDYYNGSKYCKWGGSCGGSTSSDDAFYPGALKHTEDGLSDRNNFDALITGANEINMTTNCNWSVDMVYVKAGIFKKGHAAGYKSMCKGHVVADINDYQVGDVIHYFNHTVDYNNPSTWSDWYHVAYVGEVYDDRIVTYDGGSYFTNNRNHKRVFKKSKGTDHKTMACRVINW